MTRFLLSDDGVEAALAALGDSPAVVAARLLAGGHRGVPSECETCPIADYLLKVVQGAVRVLVTDGNAALYDADGSLRGWVPMPGPCSEFIRRFDTGSWSELRAHPFAETAGATP